MEKVATEESVWRACDHLQVEGRKISGRSVLAEVGGGSLPTVLRYIETWRARLTKSAPLAAEIPFDVQDSLRRALGQAALEATEALRQQIEETTSRETEALEALEGSESRIAALGKDLAVAQAQIVELRQSHEKEAAVAAETITGLREQVCKLEQENDLLVRAGEAARTEAAKAQLQVERADQTVSKAEEKVLKLEARVTELLSSKAEAEKEKAVAERYVKDLADQAAKLESQLEKSGEKIVGLESEKTELTRELNTAESARRKAEGAGEQMVLRIQESTATIEQQRKDLEAVRKDAAAADRHKP